MSHDVFISYSSKDQQTANDVCAALEAGGITCWMAPRNILPGEKYGQAIIKGIGRARLMVLVFSSDANKSNHVEAEIDRAYKRDIPIIPFRLEDVPLSDTLEYYLSTAHWLNALTPQKEKYFQELVKSVRLLLERSPAPAQTTETAPPSTPAERIESPASPAPVGQWSLFSSNPLFKAGVLIVAAIALLLFMWIMFWLNKTDGNSNATAGNGNVVTTSNANVVSSTKDPPANVTTTPIVTNTNTANGNIETAGVSSMPKAGAVTVHYISDKAQAEAQAVRNALEVKGYAVIVKGTRTIPPSEGEVRFYHSQDESKADDVIDVIKQTIGVKLKKNSRLEVAVGNHPVGEIVVYLKLD